MAGLQACCLFALKVLVDPECPQNHGMLAPMEIRAPQGTIVNAAFPAASAARAQTGQRIVDAIFGALAGALPDRVIAAGNGANTAASFFGRGADGRYYVYLETLGGGAGARSYADGTDGVQVHMTNTSNLPIEALENEYPLMIERYELVEDSGGAGAFRGGLGLRRVYRPLGHVVSFSGQGERCVNPPWGVFGGGPGGTGRFELRAGDGAVTRLANKPSSLEVGPDTAIVVTTAGAGGYGPAAERDARVPRRGPPERQAQPRVPRARVRPAGVAARSGTAPFRPALTRARSPDPAARRTGRPRDGRCRGRAWAAARPRRTGGRIGHRVRNTQPEGGERGDGGSPSSPTARRPRSSAGSGSGAAATRARV